MEIVIVDNWSNEAQLIRLRAGLPKDVVLLENKTNLGYAAGNNTGLRYREGGGGYALIVNNDVTMNEQTTIAALVSKLESHQATGACSPLIHDVDSVVEPRIGIQVRRIPDFVSLVVVSSSLLRRLPLLHKIYEQQVYSDLRPLPENSFVPCETINGCCFLIKMSALKTIGYLDEGTFLYCEEIILGHQLRNIGLECAIVTTVCVEHEQGASAGKNASGMSFRGIIRRIRSEVYYARKYLGAGPIRLCVVILSGGIDLICKHIYIGLRVLLIGISGGAHEKRINASGRNGKN
jgi:hypothetical protein